MAIKQASHDIVSFLESGISSWKRMHRVISYVLRFIDGCRKSKKVGELSLEETDIAKRECNFKEDN